MGEGQIRSLGLADANYYIKKYINNKVLWYSTGNYIPYSVINHNREYVYTCKLQLKKKTMADTEKTIPYLKTFIFKC